ncbi:MAG: DNA-directed RNA polymerase subunit omega [Clostridia bacterium]|nr:DNA-directed RNA polymerase subunit omega [Clostridia bacterium]MBR4868181.1 DNA-directed RNA polymerase subunit omega [Clostridia bacterium]
MLNPSIGKLINEYENRYDLVIDVARRARKISNRAENDNEILTEKPVTLALDELAEEKCKD